MPPLSFLRNRNELLQKVAPLARTQARARDSGEVYRGVYYHRGGYRARVRWCGRLTTVAHERTALEAAAGLADWLASKLGPRWGEIITASKKRPWGLAPWKVRHSPANGGWIGCVWVCGSREECVRLKRSYKRWKRTENLMVWDTREEAIRGVFAWLDKVYGLLVPHVLDRGPIVMPASKFPSLAA